MFRFKQFSVDQTGCAMKINTDGVLIGAFANTGQPKKILDIGTGTGVIALMLAQRFTDAEIDAVEVDEVAAATASSNFKASPFAERLTVYPYSFEHYFEQFPDSKYDLVVSNPPFYIDSLKSPGAKKTLAKHTDTSFFESLISSVSAHLSLTGCCWLIAPVNIAELIIELGAKNDLYPKQVINVRSFKHSQPHRVILSLTFDQLDEQISNFTIYDAPGVYSEDYKKLLQAYFLAF